METRGDMIQFLTIGIGINVNNPVKGHGFKAISLKEVMDRSLSRKTILETFLTDFKERVANPSIPAIMNLWKERTATIGSQVEVKTLN